MMIQGQYHRPPCCRRSCWPFLMRCRALKGCMSCRYIMNPGCTQSIPKLQKWRYHPHSRMNRFSAISRQCQLFQACFTGVMAHHGIKTAFLTVSVFFCVFFLWEKVGQGAVLPSKLAKEKQHTPIKSARFLKVLLQLCEKCRSLRLSCEG